MPMMASAIYPAAFATWRESNRGMAISWGPLVLTDITTRAAFTISGATVTIVRADTGEVTRNDVACSVRRVNVWYLEAWTAANGYAEDVSCIVTFKATITSGGQTFVKKYQDRCRPLGVGDEP